MDLEKTALPLNSAYAFGSERGLQSEVDNIKHMEIGWDLSYTTRLLKGYIVDLFAKKGLLEEFKAKPWIHGNTPSGIKECNRYLRIREGYEEFLNGQARPAEGRPQIVRGADRPVLVEVPEREPPEISQEEAVQEAAQQGADQ